MLSPKIAQQETKICGTLMLLTPKFKGEVQSLKKRILTRIRTKIRIKINLNRT